MRPPRPCRVRSLRFGTSRRAAQPRHYDAYSSIEFLQLLTAQSSQNEFLQSATAESKNNIKSQLLTGQTAADPIGQSSTTQINSNKQIWVKDVFFQNRLLSSSAGLEMHLCKRPAGSRFKVLFKPSCLFLTIKSDSGRNTPRHVLRSVGYFTGVVFGKTSV